MLLVFGENYADSLEGSAYNGGPVHVSEAFALIFLRERSSLRPAASLEDEGMSRAHSAPQ